MTDTYNVSKGRGEFIDPRNVGSFVRYQLEASLSVNDKDQTRNGHLNMTIGLGDCSRQISWETWASANDEDEFAKELDAARVKLQRAMGVLREAQVELTLQGDIILEKLRAKKAKAKGK